MANFSLRNILLFFSFSKIIMPNKVLVISTICEKAAESDGQMPILFHKSDKHSSG